MDDIIDKVPEKKCSSCSSRCGKLDVFDWLGDLPQPGVTSDLVEVQFKVRGLSTIFTGGSKGQGRNEC